MPAGPPNIGRSPLPVWVELPFVASGIPRLTTARGHGAPPARTEAVRRTLASQRFSITQATAARTSSAPLLRAIFVLMFSR